MKNLLSMFVLLFTACESIHASATQLPLHIEECNNCSEIAMQRKAEVISSNSTVVVINADDGIIKAYDVRETVIDDYIPFGVAYERAVPADALVAFNATIASRDAHLNDLKAKFPNLEISMSDLSSVYGAAAKNVYSSASNDDATAYDFVGHSQYRRNLFRLFNDTSHYSNYKANKVISLDKLSVGFNAKFVSLSADVNFFTENIKLIFSNGSFISAEINENGETYDVTDAADADGNDIPPPASSELGTTTFEFKSATSLENFSTYVDTFWSANLSGISSYKPASCKVSCKAPTNTTYICTYKCS